jgi:Ca-activated chloride channel family protein
VLDTSGSMAEEGKMEKARAALLFGIRTLRDGDKFNIINFAGEEHLMESGLISADASGKKRGEEFIKNLQPTGGTNINDSLIAALKQFSDSNRPKMLVFMTDGLPTVGETDVNRIVANLAKAKNVNVRIFPFGFGYDVNTTLLDRIGSENSGISDYIQPKEDLEIKVSNFFQKVSSPVLSDLELDFGSVKTDMVYPRKLTDLFKGMQLTMIGRYTNEQDLKDLTVRLSGKSGNQSRTFNYENLDFPFRSEGNQFLPRLWATRRVGWLMEQIRNNGDQKELRDEVVTLGTKYGIVTPYTSYLATDGSMINATPSTVADAVSVQGARPMPTPTAGKAAVQMSVQQNSMQQNVTVGRRNERKKSADKADKDEEQSIYVENSTQNQFVGNKNFVNQNNVWVDVDFDSNSNLKEIKIKAFSDEYFALINADKEIAQYLSLGEEVVIVWKGKVYKITK